MCDRLDGCVGCCDLAVLHKNCEVLQRVAAFVVVQLADPPITILVHFHKQRAVDVVELGNHTFALLNVVALGDGARGVVQLHAFSLHRRDAAQSQFRVGEDRRLAPGVRFQTCKRVHVRRQRVVLAAPHKALAEFDAVVLDVGGDRWVVPKFGLGWLILTTLHSQLAVVVLVVGVSPHDDLGVVVLRQRFQILQELGVHVGVVLRRGDDVALDLAIWCMSTLLCLGA